MSENRLWNTVTGGKHPYGLIPVTELSGGSFKGKTIVKCADDLYLIGGEEECVLYERKTGRMQRPEEMRETAALDGFETELSFAPDCILKAAFSEGTMKLGDEAFAVKVYEASEKFYLIEEENGDVILADASRFLLYARIGGEFIGGYLEV